jgi:PDZ domain-containing secreted protein
LNAEDWFGVDAGLVNPAMRKSCFGGTLPPHRDGCLITAVAKHSTADGLLKCGDILLTIDGHTVSEKCDVQFRGQERLPFTYLVTRKPCGAEVKVKALRSRRIVATAEEAQPPVEDVVDAEGTVEDGVARATEVELTMRLKPTPYLVPKVLDLDYFATYIIVGGLVILPAGRPLQDAAIKTRRYSLYDACETIAGTIAFSELDMQGCILSDVMAHSINVSYDEMVGQVVSAVNGEPVKNMRHLAQLLQAATADDLVLDFRVPKDGEMRSFLVFDRAEALACTEEILVQNKVPAWCSPSLLEE